MKKTYIFLSTLLLLNSCAAPSLRSTQSGGVSYEGGFKYSGVYFGQDLSRDKKNGIVDGCSTANGFYKKDHYRFKEKSYSKSSYDQSYKSGWFLGRKKCNGFHIKDNAQ